MVESWYLATVVIGNKSVRCLLKKTRKFRPWIVGMSRSESDRQIAEFWTRKFLLISRRDVVQGCQNQIHGRFFILDNSLFPIHFKKPLETNDSNHYKGKFPFYKFFCNLKFLIFLLLDSIKPILKILWYSTSTFFILTALSANFATRSAWREIYFKSSRINTFFIKISKGEIWMR